HSLTLHTFPTRRSSDLFEHSMLINENAEAVSKDDYPDSWRQGALKFKVTYQFEPGADADGVTVHIPLQVLDQVSPAGFDWQIPRSEEHTSELQSRSDLV